MTLQNYGSINEMTQLLLAIQALDKITTFRNNNDNNARLILYISRAVLKSIEQLKTCLAFSAVCR